MGNRASGPRSPTASRKSVHWKSAGRPAAPGRPEVAGGADEPDAVTLRWRPGIHDGGAPLLGYQVECNRLGSAAWIRTSPPIVLRPELMLSGLEPPHRYQFRVAAVNAVGRSEYSLLSEVVTVGVERALRPPVFTNHLIDVTALENDTTEFRVSYDAAPVPTIAWFKDGYEIFSSRRTAITTDETSSILVFHQTLPTDEGEIKCTATNRAGHAITKARFFIEAAPKLRYPRQYEEGLLYEINETIYLKTAVVGKPTPTIEWLHDGVPISPGSRVEIHNTGKTSVLKVQTARREDRGEYTVRAKNDIGEDTASFLVTVTAPPDAPRRVTVLRRVDRSVSLSWDAPTDDGGCRVSNYVVEYYREGWDVWLKASTSRTCSATLYDLIEGSCYRFRVKAESPYGMSSPSEPSAPVTVPGRPAEAHYLEVEAAVIGHALRHEDGQEPDVVPRRRRRLSADETAASNEFMLVLYPGAEQSTDKTEKRKSFQLDLEEALSPPAISLSAPDISARCIMPFKALRNAVSSTELLHERAMDRFYRVLAIRDQRDQRQSFQQSPVIQIQKSSSPLRQITNAQNDQLLEPQTSLIRRHTPEPNETPYKQKVQEANDMVLNVSESLERPPSATGNHQRWQSVSFDEDYTASTVSSEEEMSGESAGDRGRFSEEEETYHPSPTAQPIQPPTVLPKPILKKRDPEPISELLPSPIIPNKKSEKHTIFKKITKMPVQRSFPFPKLINKKTLEKKPKEEPPTEVKPIESPKKSIEKSDYNISDEGRTVIDYYSNIVKEYGGQKKNPPALYLDTEQLKTAAEQQQQHKVQNKTQKVVNKTKKKQLPKKDDQDKISNQKKTKLVSASTKPVKSPAIKKEEKTGNTIIQVSKTIIEKPAQQQVVLRTAERATIVIPIDYTELEQKAQATVRSAIDYAVDVCLLGVAFWVYLFKDERLAIPPLALIIYRQMQEFIQAGIPAWIKPQTPKWLQQRTS